MARRDAADRNLLFGLLALQNGLIDQMALVGAFHAWTLDKGLAIADLLVSRGAIDADERSLIEGLAERHLKRHGGDAEQSLAGMSIGGSTREELTKLNDSRVDAILGLLQSGTLPNADDPTAPYQFGSAGTEGQRFRVLRPHAQGGLGTVFVALDGELNREVALKEIQERHADDPSNRARFVLEAEITGNLEHPGIVPVYGLGTYGNGRPYYAMRFIRGDSLKEATAAFHTNDRLKLDAGARALALRQLLRRFVDLCNAIDYAHGRGVLHRDIKPGNVMVGRHGETLVVDWGLARLIVRPEPRRTFDEPTLAPTSAGSNAETLQGSALGTPAYMSPEQAAGDLDHLGPCSDIYSLGATLYYLLTGRSPFEGDDLGFVLRAVQKGDFPPPRRRDPTIDRALEAICLKAMALVPGDRHESPKALADDIERWAADEPVSAWREPWPRRVRRWAKRNRTAVASAGVALLATLFGTSAVLVVQARANAELKKSNNALQVANARETEANANLKTANINLARANVDLAAAKDREAARFALAKEAIQLFHGQVGDDLVLKADQFKPLRDKLLNGAADFYGKLEKLLEGQPDPASRRSLGQAYFDLGELTSKIGDKPKALEAHRKALAVRQGLASGEGDPAEVARSLFATAGLLMATSKKADALADYERALALLEALPAPVDDHRALMGRVLAKIGSILDVPQTMARSKAAFERSLAMLGPLVEAHPEAASYRADLAVTLQVIAARMVINGDPAGAMATYRRVRELRQKLVEDHPAVADYQSDLARTINNIAVLQSSAGDQDGALKSYRQSLAIRRKLAEDNPAVTTFRADVAGSLVNIGNLQSLKGDKLGALESTRQALAIRRKLADENPTALALQTQLTSTLYNLGNMYLSLEDRDRALQAYREASTLQRKLIDANPTFPGLNFTLARIYNNIGAVLYSASDLDGALASYRLALPIQRKLADDNPAVLVNRAELARVLNNIGVIEATTDHLADALEMHRQGLAIRRKLVEVNPTADSRSELALSHVNIGSLQIASGDTAGGLESHRQALAIQQGLVDGDPAATTFRSDLGRTHRVIGSLMNLTGHPAEALESYRRAASIHRKLVEDHPDVPGFRSELADSIGYFGKLLDATGDVAGALAAHREALAIGRKLVEDHPAVPAFRDALATIHINIGGLLHATGDPAGSLASTLEGESILRKLVGDYPDVAAFRANLATACSNLGLLLSSTGDPAGALGFHRRALAIRRKLADESPSVVEHRSGLASSHLGVGALLASAGDLAGALSEQERACAIARGLVDAHPTIPGHKDVLASALAGMAGSLQALGRVDEALVARSRAIAIREEMVDAHPTLAGCRADLASSLRGMGMARLAVGDVSGAVADVRRAVTLLEGSTGRSARDWYELARGHFLLVGLAGRHGPELSEEESEVAADQVVECLRRAVAGGHRDSGALAREEVPGPLLQRPEFRLLVLDLAFPTNPFTRAD